MTSTREASDRFLTEICGWKILGYWDKKQQHIWKWLTPSGETLLTADPNPVQHSRASNDYIPDPMGNLQDAIEQVPEGWDMIVGGRNKNYGAMIHPDRIDEDMCQSDEWSYGKTPAEALCQAIRKAKEKEKDSD